MLYSLGLRLGARVLWSARLSACRGCLRGARGVHGLGLQLLPHKGLVEQVRHAGASLCMLAKLLQSHGLRTSRTL